jgi:predicted RNase H-like HicB family nuclease
MVAAIEITLASAHQNEKMRPMRKLSVIIEKDESGYYAFSPDLPGCQSQGDSFEEAITNIKEAISLYLETLSAEELQELASREIFSTTVEVSVAQS